MSETSEDAGQDNKRCLVLRFTFYSSQFQIVVDTEENRVKWVMQLIYL